MKINPESKTKGVSYDAKSGKYRARLTTSVKRLFLGRFDTKRDAIVARKTAEAVAHELSVAYGRR